MTQVVAPLVAGITYRFTDFKEIEDSGAPAEADVWPIALIVFLTTLWLCMQLSDYLQQEDIRGYKETARFTAELAESFKTLVGRKADRVREALSTHQTATVYRLKGVLAPDSQISFMVQLVHQTFAEMLKQDKLYGQTTKLRVAYFRRTGVNTDDDTLERVISNNGINENLDPVETPDRFRINPQNREVCLAVRAAYEGSILYVPDTKKADEDENEAFSFFDQSGDSEMKSMVAIPLKRRDDPCGGVVVADTDIIGFFDRDKLSETAMEVLKDDLSQRMLFEEDMRTLLG